MATLVAVAVAVAALVAGCGDDEARVQEDTAGGEASTAPRTSTGPETTTAPEGPETEPKTAGEPETGPGGGATAPEGGGEAEGPEQQPGGAGDEIPASSQALLTGRGGRISPRVVRVPPFIAIRVQLRSADGETYTLRSGGDTLIAGGGVEAMSATLEGLRPGRRVVLSGPSGRVTIEASAEPGP